jgi:methionyl-tRNA formyltransferase
MRKLKIVFFGSGPVAAKSLELLAKDFEIEAVVTKPKPEHHRGDFPVLRVSEKLKLKTYTITNKRELSELIATKPFLSDIGVLIDFGIIVAQDTIDYFKKGIINSHFSLLPQWRGADPIAFAILSGQEKTGVSLMVIDAGMDTGKIIAFKSLPISQNSTTPSLTEELIMLSDKLLKEFLPKYYSGLVRPRSQPHPARTSYSRKLTKEDGNLDWTKPAAQLEREIRAYIEWPKSHTKLAGIDAIITRGYVSDNDGKPGKVEINDKQLFIYCGQGALVIEKLKPAGKNEMTSQAFLAGYGKLL